MSWLRTRRRSLDIVNKRSELDSSNGTNNNNSMDEGRYLGIRKNPSTKGSNKNYMTGILSNGSSLDEVDGRRNDDELTTCGIDCASDHLLNDINVNEHDSLIDIHVGRKRKEKQLDEYFENRSNNSIDDSESMIIGDHIESYNGDNISLSYQENTTEHYGDETKQVENKSKLWIDSDTEAFRNCSISESDNDEEEEDRDLFPDDEQQMKNFRERKNFHRPRCSLDSQLALLPGYNNNINKNKEKIENSLESLSEDTPLEETNLPVKKKSISWASDLETIHEFQKIKSRRLSLSSLFKKW